MDTVSKDRRSENMRKIRSKDTKPEVYLRHLLFAKGFRYRLYNKKIPGTPDLFLRKYNTAIFVNGCFWHRHKGCKYATIPKSNTEFWDEKFSRNVKRDKRQLEELREKGIRVIVVWECTIKKMRKNISLQIEIINTISNFLKDFDSSFLEL